MTAAHCVTRSKPFQLNIQYASNILDVNSTKVSDVSYIYEHEGYNRSNRYIHDIALLRLAMPIKLKKNFESVRLPELKASIPNKTPAILIGWGLNAVSRSAFYRVFSSKPLLTKLRFLHRFLQIKKLNSSTTWVDIAGLTFVCMQQEYMNVLESVHRLRTRYRNIRPLCCQVAIYFEKASKSA